MSKFCIACGAELPDNARFCTRCGAKISEESSGTSEPSHSAFAGSSQPKPPLSPAAIWESFWNAQWFTWAAIKFCRVINWVWLAFGIFLLFAGWWIYGIIFITTACGYILAVHERKQKRAVTACPSCGKKVKIGVNFCTECGAEIPVKEIPPDDPATAGKEEGSYSLRAKKIGLLISAVVFSVMLVLVTTSGDALFSNPIGNIKTVTFEDCGSLTMEELADQKLKGAKWFQEKIDDGTYHVFLQDYSPYYGEDVKIQFYFDDQNDGTFEYRLDKLTLLDSGTIFQDPFELMFAFAMLY